MFRLMLMPAVLVKNSGTFQRFNVVRFFEKLPALCELLEWPVHDNIRITEAD